MFCRVTSSTGFEREAQRTNKRFLRVFEHKRAARRVERRRRRSFRDGRVRGEATGSSDARNEKRGHIGRERDLTSGRAVLHRVHHRQADTCTFVLF